MARSAPVKDAAPTTANKPAAMTIKFSPTDEQRQAHLTNIQNGSYTRQDIIRTGQWPIRYQHNVIRTVRDLKETLRCGSSTDLGGYSEALSYEAAKENFRTIIEAMSERYGSPDWKIVALDVNWEDEDLVCSHTNQRIECAYPKDEELTDSSSDATNG
jgi:hypothetical protein